MLASRCSPCWRWFRIERYAAAPTALRLVTMGLGLGLALGSKQSALFLFLIAIAVLGKTYVGALARGTGRVPLGQSGRASGGHRNRNVRHRVAGVVDPLRIRHRAALLPSIDAPPARTHHALRCVAGWVAGSGAAADATDAARPPPWRASGVFARRGLQPRLAVLLSHRALSEEYPGRGDARFAHCGGSRAAASLPGSRELALVRLDCGVPRLCNAEPG